MPRRTAIPRPPARGEPEQLELLPGGGPSRLARRLLEAHERLARAYLAGRHYLDEEELLDPLSDLVHALLGHRTRYEDNDRAFRALRARYGDGEEGWARARDADPHELEQVIRGVTWPELKAPRIQAVLREISRLRQGRLDLGFLAELPPREARDWLERLPGVGPKTSAIVVLYSTLRMPALVLDTHHYRVCERLGLFPAGADLPRAEAALERLLPPSWGAVEYADHHLALFSHGQECCFARGPACRRCPVLDLCPYGRRRAGRPRSRR